MARAMQKGPVGFTSPRWAGDYVGHDSIMPVPGKLDPAQFGPEAAVVVDVGAAGAAIGATSVPTAALSGPIPNGTKLDFGIKGFVVLTLEALTGAVALTTEPLTVALVDADTATYPGSTLTQVPSGTAVGRTFAERDAGSPWGPAGAADDEIFLTVFDVADLESLNDGNNDVEFYRPGKIVKENYLPAFSSLNATVKAAIRAKYLCIIGKE